MTDNLAVQPKGDDEIARDETITVPLETIEQQTPHDPAIDWRLLDDDRVEGIARQAAGKIGSEFSGITSADDQYQEAVLCMANNSAHVREYLRDPLFGERYLYRWLYHRLHDGLHEAMSYSQRTTTLEAAHE